MLKWQAEGKCWVAHVIEGDPKQGWYEIEQVRSWYEIEHERYAKKMMWRCAMIRLCSNGKMAPIAEIEAPTLEQAKAIAQRHWSTGIWRAPRAAIADDGS